MQSPRNSRRVGRVVGLWRYPVKSMGAEALTEVDVSWHGLAGDRRWAFVRNDATRSGFPWLTLRQCQDMNHYQPSFVDPEHPDQSATIVKTPSGDVYDIDDPALREGLSANEVQLIKQDRGVFDTFPLSLITTQTIERLAELTGAQLDVRRFRPNLLVEAHREEAFSEDAWVGSVLRIGESRLRIDKRDGRCVVITIDPDTTEKDPTILRTVAQEREGCLGVYGTTVAPGRITRGDAVFLESELRV